MYRVVQETPWVELERQVRAVHLLQPRNDQLVHPYENAQITLEDVTYEKVRPTSLYVVRDHLEAQRQLADDFATQGYDPLALSEGLSVQLDDNEPVGLIPPVVEETDEDGLYQLDGMHRAYLGWKAGRLAFRAIVIRSIRPDCPAAARPSNWDEIVEYDAVPENPQLKRRYRIDNHLSLRRDFSALNGSRPRAT